MIQPYWLCLLGTILIITVARADDYEIDGKEPYFENPIRLSGPDPSLVYVDGGYFLTYTSDTHIQMTRSTTLGGLYDGETRTFWTDSNDTRSAHMWAPEIHRIHDFWYVLYSSCKANDSTATCQTRILQGCDGPNPYDCDYDWLADLVPPTGRQGGRFKNETFSIDGTYLEIAGQSYHVVSALDSGGVQAIQITELNTTSWTVSGWNIISRADQTWEMNATNTVPSPGVAGINEGPHPLYHNGEIWLSYSGSFCGTPGYSLGLLHYLGGDPLQQASWEKVWPGPALMAANGNYGTGHNSFFISPDGTEIWNAFHATDNETGYCGDERYTMAHIVEFDENDVPYLGRPQRRGQRVKAPSGERKHWYTHEDNGTFTGNWTRRARS